MNLNIEGTKHEKAVLVILSYVVGFTAGFIVFGLSQPAALKSAVATPVAVAPEMVDPVTEVSGDMMEVSEVSDLSQQVMYQDGRLMANANGASVLLSAQIETVDSETAKAFANQGVHQDIPQYLASEDGNFIYFCEQHPGEDTCINFIYRVNDEIIQYVTLDGAKLESTPEEAKAATWVGGILTVGTNRALSPETPWKLTSAQ